MGIEDAPESIVNTILGMC